VTNGLTPDVTGTYIYAGKFQGKPYYYHPPVDEVIWWTGTDRWIISQILGDTTGIFWDHISPDIEGAYNPQGGAVGIATVTEI